MGKFKDLTGQQFGNWKVLEYCGESYWLCECQCERHTRKKVYRGNLLSGKSCGCGICNRALSIKANNYDLTGQYGIGYASNNQTPFYFDLEDYDKIKDHC